jgi:hypothetical protein
MHVCVCSVCLYVFVCLSVCGWVGVCVCGCGWACVWMDVWVGWWVGGGVGVGVGFNMVIGIAGCMHTLTDARVGVGVGFNMVDFVLLSPLIYSGEHLKHDKTTSFRCSRLQVKGHQKHGIKIKCNMYILGKIASFAIAFRSIHMQQQKTLVPLLSPGGPDMLHTRTHNIHTSTCQVYQVQV